MFNLVGWIYNGMAFATMGGMPGSGTGTALR